MVGRRRGWIAAACVAVGLAGLGCGADPGGSAPAGEFTVRDSAGIRIVENGLGPVASWPLSDSPTVVVGPGLSPDEMALDPTAVFPVGSDLIGVGDGNQVGWDAVLVYDRSGRLVQRMGGRGPGPGEFGGQLWWAGGYRVDSIVAWDRRGPRGPSMKVFGPDGTYARDVHGPPLELTITPGMMTFSPGWHGAFADGAFLSSSRGVAPAPAEPGLTRYRHALTAVHADGSGFDAIGEFDLIATWWDGEVQESYLFGPPGLVMPYGNDLLLANSADYEYRILSRDGAGLAIVRGHSDPQRVSDEDVEAMVAGFVESAGNIPAEQVAALADRFRAMPRAETKPAYSSVIVDDDRYVWVERFRWMDPWGLPADPVPTVWDVFSPEGRRVAEVVVPERMIVLSVAGERVLGVRIDDSDVREVVEYRVVRGDAR